MIAPVKMMEEEAAAKKAVSSIGDKNKRFNGRHPRGKIEELGQLVYKSNTKDSADMISGPLKWLLITLEKSMARICIC